MGRKGHYKHQPLVDLTCSASDLPPAPAVPVYEPRPVYHGDGCDCESCCDIRTAMDVYLSARENYLRNGFQ